MSSKASFSPNIFHIFLRNIILVSLLVNIIQAQEELIIGTGEIGKNYFRIGNNIKDILTNYGFQDKIIVTPTSGSTDNLKRLQNGEIDLAIVQNDAAFFAENGLYAFKDNSITTLSTVISLYKEPVFFLTEKSIRTIGQLSNKEISIGLINSGTSITSEVILRSIGLWDQVLSHNYNQDRSEDLLKNNELDGIVISSISKKTKELINNGIAHFLPISNSLISQLNNTYPYFSSYTQKFNGKATNTIAVTAMLIATNEVEPKIINKIVTILNSHYKEIFKDIQYKQLKNHFYGNSLENWHIGVIDYFDKNNIAHSSVDISAKYIVYILSIFIIVLFILILIAVFVMHHANIFHRYSGSHSIIKVFKKTHSLIINHKYFFLLFFIILTLILFILVIKYFEHKWALQNNVISVFDEISIKKSLLWLFVFSSSGYDGNIFPQSEIGKVMASFSPLLGVGGVVAFIGLITYDHFYKYFLEVRGMGSKKIKDHIILCGWNNSAHLIIENLYHKNIVHKGKQIVILADQKYEIDIKKYDFDPMFVFYVGGNSTNRGDLLRANLQEADIAIIIADSDSRNPDAESILKVLTVEKFSMELEGDGRRLNRENIYSIVEIRDPQNIQLAEDAGADQIVSLGSIETKIFTQAIRNPGVSKFINEIVTFNDQNDIYSFIVSKDSYLCGITYDEMLASLRKHNILLLSINIAYKKNHNETEELMKKYHLNRSVITNPFNEAERDYKTKDSDLVVVLAQYEKVLLAALKKLSK